MVDYKSLCHLTILLMSLSFMLVHCSLEPADQLLDNPTEGKQDTLVMHKRPSFFVGSRYGRAGGSSTGSGGAYATSKTRRLSVVPRNDRFFLGSRYGKRAGTLTNVNSQLPLASTVLSTPYEQALFSEISAGTQLSNKPGDDFYSDNDWISNNDNSNNNNNNNSPAAFYMSCIYTGLQDFYRCNSIDKIFKIKNTTPLYINDDGYNDFNGHNYDDDNDDDKDVDADVDEDVDEKVDEDVDEDVDDADEDADDNDEDDQKDNKKKQMQNVNLAGDDSLNNLHPNGDNDSGDRFNDAGLN